MPLPPWWTRQRGRLDRQHQTMRQTISDLRRRLRRSEVEHRRMNTRLRRLEQWCRRRCR